MEYRCLVHQTENKMVGTVKAVQVLQVWNAHLQKSKDRHESDNELVEWDEEEEEQVNHVVKTLMYLCSNVMASVLSAS